MGLSHTNQENSGHSYTFFFFFFKKKRANHIPGSAEKGGHSASHPYYTIYRKLPSPPPTPTPRGPVAMFIAGLDPEGLKTGGGGCIDCRRHVSSGVSRESGRGGEYERGSPLIRGSGGLPREIFKTGLPESA